MAAGMWRRQSQGISPKVLKTLRRQAANMAHLQALGSVDIVLDLQEAGIKGPRDRDCVSALESVGEILRRAEDISWVQRTWRVLWNRLSDKHRWKRVAGPMGAMICYLKELGIESKNMLQWKWPDGGHGTLPTAHRSRRDRALAEAAIRGTQNVTHQQAGRRCSIGKRHRRDGAKTHTQAQSLEKSESRVL